MKRKLIDDNSIDSGTRTYSLLVRGPDGSQLKDDNIAEEKAVAMVYNGISHAVMMATPLDLADFALGFSLTEGIIEKPSQLKSVDIVQSDLGYELQMDIASSAFMQLKQRRRQLSGRSGCGICGLESLEAVKPAVEKICRDKSTSENIQLPDYDAVANGIKQLQEQQVLQSQCGAVHASAFVGNDGKIILLREDVGRHNALDKLLGAIAYKKIDKNDGFVVVSSRASYEMVYKTATQSIGTLVAASAPTGMAIDLALEAQMNLIGFVRPGRQLIYCQSDANELSVNS